MSQETGKQRVIRISVVSAGAILLDGKSVDLDRIEQTLKSAKDAVVWYHRESAGQDAPPQVRDLSEKIIAMVIGNRLPISLSAKSDFTDAVDASGKSHPREPSDLTYEPRMPDVSTGGDIEKLFTHVRKLAAGDDRAIVIVRPDRNLLICPTWTDAEARNNKLPPASLNLISSDVNRNIAVIGYTGFLMENIPQAGPRECSSAIPFFGLLLAESHAGHAVWIFEGHRLSLASGCRKADILIADSGMLPFLQADWHHVAAKVMRNPNILIHDREVYKLRIVQKVGNRNDRLEFQE